MVVYMTMDMTYGVLHCYRSIICILCSLGPKTLNQENEISHPRCGYPATEVGEREREQAIHTSRDKNISKYQ